MNYDKARAELDAVLAVLMTDKKMKQSDKLLNALPYRNDSRWNDIEWKKTHDDVVKKTMESKYWKDAHQKGVTKRTADPAWNEANRKARFKPIVTPFGVFNSLDSATEYVYNNKLLPTRHTIPSIKNYIRSKTKLQPKEYYYISKEEYIMLTGKEI
tara:strand:- start:8 stop:475 length:468 start_codon:yes stop_codon:yes gene_type:complete